MSSPHSFRPFFITGPTGSGKSALALALSRLVPSEIVNADAFQLYRGIPILTAAPTDAEQRICPHHLYAILDPSQSCDAGRYLNLAHPVLRDVAQRGRIPLVTGGSGLYVKALTHGLDPAVAVIPSIRAALAPLSLEEIRERLAAVDPASLSRIGPHNRRYLQRALEITLSTSRPASQLRTAWDSSPPGLRGVRVERSRDDLFARTDLRVRLMMERGALPEVTAVSSWSTTSLQAIGAREIQSHLRGEMNLEECILQIQQATHRYAKRQITWFRRESWLHPLPSPPGDDWDPLARQLLPLLT